MKLKLKDVKPGMCIKSKYLNGYVMYIKTSTTRHDSFYGKKPFISLFDMCDLYDGPMSSQIDLETKVKIVTGPKRALMIKKIQQEQRSHMFQIERNLRQLDAYELILG